MKTLLQPGDKVTIRSDIRGNVFYKMLTDNEISDLWLDKMIQPNEQVTIRKISNDGKYAIMEDRLFTYTDEMFDPDLMQYLYNSR